MRADDAGNGFAVDASEVKNFAAQVARATEGSAGSSQVLATAGEPARNSKRLKQEVAAFLRTVRAL